MQSRTVLIVLCVLPIAGAFPCNMAADGAADFWVVLPVINTEGGIVQAAHQLVQAMQAITDNWRCLITASIIIGSSGGSVFIQ